MEIDYTNLKNGARITLTRTVQENPVKHKEIIYGEFVSVKMIGTSKKFESLTYRHILNLESYLKGDKRDMIERTVLHSDGFQVPEGFMPA